MQKDIHVRTSLRPTFIVLFTFHFPLSTFCCSVALRLSKLNLRLLRNIFSKSLSEFEKTWFQDIGLPGRPGPVRNPKTLLCSCGRTDSKAYFSIHCAQFRSLESSTHQEGGLEKISIGAIIMMIWIDQCFLVAVWVTAVWNFIKNAKGYPCTDVP